ncbi:hypothetical protein GCM10028806_33650 [Spirosoma terrae]|uniref:Uncharacterized protein n=1 Tax=Spirosoma terrae TaxID=1968276 RepID=A0A6L9LB51_9BACT|nr:hypothetical protein [Spirosoma terrae]NDU95678.1 hypothetical protein [Spirosoma terrae]
MKTISLPLDEYQALVDFKASRTVEVIFSGFSFKEIKNEEALQDKTRDLIREMERLINQCKVERDNMNRERNSLNTQKREFFNQKSEQEARISQLVLHNRDLQESLDTVQVKYTTHLKLQGNTPKWIRNLIRKIYGNHARTI